jgi:hypothetical protein
MFCPKCAAQNIDSASFCRVCGANISLVPQALSGQLPVAQDDTRGSRRSRRRNNKEPTLEHSLKNVFMGLAFLCISIALARSFAGAGWWFWMLIPAFSLLGTGVAEFIRIAAGFDSKLLRGDKQPLNLSAPAQPSFGAPPRGSQLPTANTGELLQPPPSVTEGTTRHLGAEAPTRHLDPTGEAPK